MLQFYDKHLTLSVLALAALTGPALADTAPALETAATTSCELSDGLPVTPRAFAGEAAACLDAAPSQAEQDIASRIDALTEYRRARFNMEPLGHRASLDAAARLHALDMATRGYGAHTSPEGLGHLDRVRRIDRSVLIGASGANITIVPAGTEPIDAFNALISDPVNAENLVRDAFTHAGVGVAEAANGQVYIVQVFAQVDGELDEPLAYALNASHPVGATFADARFEQAGWRLSVPETGASTRGYGDALGARRLGDGVANLAIEAELGNRVYELSGPAVEVN